MLIKIQKNPFTIIFILWYATEILFNTTLTEIMGIAKVQLNSIINYLVLGVLLFQIIIFQKYKVREIVLIIFITIPIVVSAVSSSYLSLLSTWMFIVAAKKTELERIINIAYKILLVMLPLVIGLHFLGYIDEIVFVRNSVIRHSLGFSHPNQLGLRIFQLVACRCYLRRTNFKVADFIFILFAALFVYLIPNSQTAYICIFILFVLLLIYIFIEKYNKELLGIYMNGLLIMTIFFNFISVLCSVVGVNGSPIIKKVNDFISLRFSRCHRIFQMYGVTFWGQKIYVSMEERKLAGLSVTEILYLDNAYMTLLIRLGILSYSIFSIIIIISMIYYKKRKYVTLLIIFSVYALYGVMESGWFLMTHNIFLIAISNVLYGKEKLQNRFVHKNIINNMYGEEAG